MAIGLTSCQKIEVSESQPEPTPTQEPASPTPSAVVSSARPRETNYFAPPGVYFLLTATSVVTDDGVTGLRPGTRLVRQPDGKFSANGILLELHSDQITNDLRIAARVAGADQAAQAAIRQALQATPPPQPISITPTAQQPAVSAQAPVALESALIPERDNPLDAKAKRVNPDIGVHSRIH